MKAIQLTILILFLSPCDSHGERKDSISKKEVISTLRQIRNELMPHRLWGPCLHEGKCPLAEGRDWCHFSVPAELPGTFFKKFSIKLGSKREWLKFSFIWVAENFEKDKKLILSEQTQPKIVRVVSDPMRTPRGNQNQLCSPGTISWIKTPTRPLYRGDVIPGVRHDPLPQPKFKMRRK